MVSGVWLGRAKCCPRGFSEILVLNVTEMFIEPFMEGSLGLTYIQCTLDISRLVGSKQWYRDISESAIYRATVMS